MLRMKPMMSVYFQMFVGAGRVFNIGQSGPCLLLRSGS